MSENKTYFYCDLDTAKGEEDLAWGKFTALVHCAVTGEGSAETKEALEEWKSRNRLEVPEPINGNSQDIDNGQLNRLVENLSDEESETDYEQSQYDAVRTLGYGDETEQELDDDSEQSDTNGSRDFEAIYDDLLSAGAGDGNIWHSTPARRSNVSKSVPFAPIKEVNAKNSLGNREDTGLPKLLSERGGFYSSRSPQATKAERFEGSVSSSQRRRITRSQTRLSRNLCEELEGATRANSPYHTGEN